ncbi:hypothetical protein FAIPA1_40140 [Frankia sp. AiPs1]
MHAAAGAAHPVQVAAGGTAAEHGQDDRGGKGDQDIGPGELGLGRIRQQRHERGEVRGRVEDPAEFLRAASEEPTLVGPAEEHRQHPGHRQRDRHHQIRRRRDGLQVKLHEAAEPDDVGGHGGDNAGSGVQTREDQAVPALPRHPGAVPVERGPLLLLRTGVVRLDRVAERWWRNRHRPRTRPLSGNRSGFARRVGCLGQSTGPEQASCPGHGLHRGRGVGGGRDMKGSIGIGIRTARAYTVRVRALGVRTARIHRDAAERPVRRCQYLWMPGEGADIVDGDRCFTQLAATGPFHRVARRSLCGLRLGITDNSFGHLADPSQSACLVGLTCLTCLVGLVGLNSGWPESTGGTGASTKSDTDDDADAGARDAHDGSDPMGAVDTRRDDCTRRRARQCDRATAEPPNSTGTPAGVNHVRQPRFDNYRSTTTVRRQRGICLLIVARRPRRTYGGIPPSGVNVTCVALGQILPQRRAGHALETVRPQADAYAVR